MIARLEEVISAIEPSRPLLLSSPHCELFELA